MPRVSSRRSFSHLARLVSAALALSPVALAACSAPHTGSDGEVVPSGSTSAQAGSGGAKASSFASRVISFKPGPGATFGQDRMPDVVLGPPRGGGDGQGGLDVVSLGQGGEIVIGFDQDIVDGDGVDFIVFENPFFVAGDPDKIWKELGEVSVSEDGSAWTTFPCDPSAFKATICAGWHPVYSSPDDGISPLDPAKAGGDPFDLADVGVSRARYVKIRDLHAVIASPSTGFDLDAIAIVHGSGG